ncbi:MAG: DUF6127 family protein, partial [Alphaproteobacteria bacterium]
MIAHSDAVSQDLLSKAAEAGARKALASIGLDDKGAYKDIQ